MLRCSIPLNHLTLKLKSEYLMHFSWIPILSHGFKLKCFNPKINAMHDITETNPYLYKKLFICTSGVFKEKRIYIRKEFRESLGMNFFSPFQPEREFKVYRSCKCSQIICSRVH